MWKPLFGRLRRCQPTVFNLIDRAQKTWRKLDGHNQLPMIIQGAKFTNGLEVAVKPSHSSPNRYTDGDDYRYQDGYRHRHVFYRYYDDGYRARRHVATVIFSSENCPGRKAGGLSFSVSLP
jgi:hypothetical protein